MDLVKKALKLVDEDNEKLRQEAERQLKRREIVAKFLAEAATNTHLRMQLSTNTYYEKGARTFFNLMDGVVSDQSDAIDKAIKDLEYKLLFNPDPFLEKISAELKVARNTSKRQIGMLLSVLTNDPSLYDGVDEPEVPCPQ